MNKKELKNIIRECLKEEASKYGKKKYKLRMTKDFDSGMGVFKKGETVNIDGYRDNYGYLIAGHGLTIDIPLTHAELVVVQGKLPDELQSKLEQSKLKLNSVLKARTTYYSDVFTKEDVDEFVASVEDILKKIKTAVPPERES